MTLEVWKDIDGFDGYQVSDKGRVRSFKPSQLFPDSEEDPHIMSAVSDDGCGYLKVMLRRDGKSYCRKIHRLVAEAFVKNPNPDINDTVDHISNDKKDNRKENLRWISRRQNVQKAYHDGLHDKRIKKNRQPILIQYTFTGEEKDFQSILEAAEYLGVDYTTISHAFGKNRTGRVGDYYMWKI